MILPIALGRSLAPWLGSLLLAAGAIGAPTAGVVSPAAIGPQAGRKGVAFRLPFKLARPPRVGKNGRFGAPRRYGPHDGVDFAVPTGTPIYASRPGTVVHVHPFDLLSDWGRGYGGLVIVTHANGSRTWYGHLGRIDVRRGQKVTRDTLLGLSGDEDNGDSQGPHLHFMILDRHGKALNPSEILKNL